MSIGKKQDDLGVGCGAILLFFIVIGLITSAVKGIFRWMVRISVYILRWEVLVPAAIACSVILFFVFRYRRRKSARDMIARMTIQATEQLDKWMGYSYSNPDAYLSCIFTAHRLLQEADALVPKAKNDELPGQIDLLFEQVQEKLVQYCSGCADAAKGEMLACDRSERDRMIGDIQTAFEPYQRIMEPETMKKTDSIFVDLKHYSRSLDSMDFMDRLSGLEFEGYVAGLLKRNRFTNVVVTRASGDQGVDIIATKDFIKYAFQCKHYSSKLDNTPVQEVYAGKSFYGCQVGVVVTNQFFTDGAKELADKIGVLLWDRTFLASLVLSAEDH